jgi:hypothetical protein
MFRYRLVDQRVPAMWRSLAAARLMADDVLPGNAPGKRLESVPAKRRTMRRSRYREEQIIGILKEHQAGLSAQDLCRKHGISDATFYKWRSKYGGLDVSDARKLKA